MSANGSVLMDTFIQPVTEALFMSPQVDRIGWVAGLAGMPRALLRAGVRAKFCARLPPVYTIGNASAVGSFGLLVLWSVVSCLIKGLAFTTLLEG